MIQISLYVLNIRILFLFKSQVLSVPSQEEGEQEECDCEGVFKVTEELGGVVLNAYMVGLTSDHSVIFCKCLF